MHTCNFNAFMQMLKPWLNDEYIRQAHLNADKTLTLRFVDGGYQTYHIDECTSDQLTHTMQHMQENGVEIIG